ncbi:hypothetical protein [Paludisphaera rhizosphaerae]|uniref:hypothetical protein n=1 Tax=Paludisphaera rhizosphaerae TaxID=2711216 RepID=UPI0013EBE33E|nr:hypothetical protein [Paludisphaera rhizosphaerae]
MTFATAMILGVLASGLTPLERSQANYAVTRAKVQFRFAYDRLAGSGVEDPATVILGTWACDGRTEHLRWRPEEGGPGLAADEVLWNGTTLVSRRPRSLEVAEGEGAALPEDARSPLWWGMATSFPHMIESVFPGVTPELLPGVRDGRPVEVESYHKISESGWIRIEVAYDPSIGWLPRTARLIKFDRGSGTATGLTVEVQEAWRCASGGYVPTGWDCETWELGGLDAKNGESPDFTPMGGRRATAHFRATSSLDLDARPAIITTGPVRAIEGPGGSVPLALEVPPITLDEARRLLGPKIKAPSPPKAPAESPNRDAAAVLLALATAGLIAWTAVRAAARWLQ